MNLRQKAQPARRDPRAQKPAPSAPALGDTNFPVLLLSIYWRGLSTRGAVAGGSLGLITAVTLTILSPTVWVQVLGHPHAIYPYEHPALFPMIVAFAGVFIFSITDTSARALRESAMYENQLVDCEIGMVKQT